MENTNWKLLVRLLKTYHHRLKIVNDVYDRFSKGENVVLSDDQKRALYKIYLDSWYKKKIDRELFEAQERQETMSYTKQMNDKFAQTYDIQPVIGFHQKSTLTTPHNRYTVDVSNDAIKKSRLEKFDAIFGDD